MKTIKRTHLPDSITYNKKTYKRGARTEKSIRVEVLSTRLKYRTDLHGHPYSPTVWYFNPVK